MPSIADRGQLCEMSIYVSKQHPVYRVKTHQPASVFALRTWWGVPTRSKSDTPHFRCNPSLNRRANQRSRITARIRHFELFVGC